MLAVLASTAAAAQQPYRTSANSAPPSAATRPAGQSQPGATAAPRPGTYANPTRPAAGLPAGYRLAGGTRQSPPPAAERTGPAGSTGGKVMYFHKPAGATAPDSPPGTGGVTTAAGTDLPPVPAGIPDAPLPTPSTLPTPPPLPATVFERPTPAPTPESVTTPPVAPETGAVQAQPEAQPKPKKADTPDGRPIPKEVTQVPPWRQVAQMYDDATLRRKIYESTAEALKRTPEEVERVSPFPPLNPVAPPGATYVPKTASLPPGRVVFEPGFVLHRRLHFEQKNAERYGWDLGIIHPVVATAAFYKDMLLLPNSLASGLEVGFWDTSAGKCLPGSPVPLYLYPPGLTLTGLAASAGVYTGGAFILHPVGAGNALDVAAKAAAAAR